MRIDKPHRQQTKEYETFSKRSEQRTRPLEQSATWSQRNSKGTHWIPAPAHSNSSVALQPEEAAKGSSASNTQPRTAADMELECTGSDSQLPLRRPIGPIHNVLIYEVTIFARGVFRVVNQNKKKNLLTGRSEQDNGVSLAEDVEEGLDVENGEVEEDAEEERQGQGGQRPSVARRQHDEREKKANLKADEGGERRLDRACLLLFLFRDDSPSAADLPRRTA